MDRVRDGLVAGRERSGMVTIECRWFFRTKPITSLYTRRRP